MQGSGKERTPPRRVKEAEAKAQTRGPREKATGDAVEEAQKGLI